MDSTFTPMLVHIRTWIRNPTKTNPFSSILNQKPNFLQTLTVKMSLQSTSKRPFCLTCSKPTRLCLCNRIQNPGLENSVSVTILQHSLEKDHPLNSARIATLGLKNVTVLNVSDVHFEARFDIRLLGSVEKDLKCCSLPVCENASESSDFDQVIENVNGFDSDGGNVRNLDFEQVLECLEDSKMIDSNVKYGMSNCRSECVDLDTADGLVLEPEHAKKCINAEGTFGSETPRKDLVKESVLGVVLADKAEGGNANTLLQVAVDPDGADRRGSEVPAITASIDKYGVNCSISHSWVPQTEWAKPDFDQLMSCSEAVDALAKGFVVKKLQKSQLNGSIELEEYKEFELEVPPGSVLLFPSDKAVGVEGIEAAGGFKVKNLIVLDGTWAKAKRLYNENPWLKLLPHLKLDMDQMSLYSEVRQQPRLGYLSTIESIVYTLKALGDNPKELDNLLDVFESMVGDQRRCKDERLSKVPRV